MSESWLWASSFATWLDRDSHIWTVDLPPMVDPLRRPAGVRKRHTWPWCWLGRQPGPHNTQLALLRMCDGAHKLYRVGTLTEGAMPPRPLLWAPGSPLGPPQARSPLHRSQPGARPDPLSSAL